MLPTAAELCSEPFWEDVALASGCPFRDSEAATYLAEDRLTNGLKGPPSERASQSLKSEGYARVYATRVWEYLECGEVSRAIDELAKRTLPPVFVFALMTPWRMLHDLDALLAMALDVDYHAMPAFWAWDVPARAGARGWEPHRDSDLLLVEPDGSPLTLTVWIPLTPATPDNGCMYLVPRDRDLDLSNAIAKGPPGKSIREEPWFDPDALPVDAARALPAHPGEALIWDHNVAHWSGRASSDAHRGRRSLSMEFQSARVSPLGSPLIARRGMPSLAGRLRLCARMILRYRHMHGLGDDVLELAREIEERKGRP